MKERIIVSFKNNSIKINRINDRKTIVTITGYVKLPWYLIMATKPTKNTPSKYISSDVNSNVNLLNGTMILTAIGTAKRNIKDTDDPVLAQRIAESRAKLRLYTYMYEYLYNASESLLKFLDKNIRPIIYVFRDSTQNDICIVNDTTPIKCSGPGLLFDTIYYNRLIQHEKQHIQDLIAQGTTTKSSK